MDNREILEIIDRAFALLGKSEKDPAITGLMTKLGIDMPFKRPPCDEVAVGLESQLTGLDLNFRYFSASNFPSASYGKEDMYFADLFVDGASLAIAEDELLPLNISFGMSRVAARALLGSPEWSSIPRLRADRWLVGDRRVHLTFSKDEDRIRLVTYTYA